MTDKTARVCDYCGKVDVVKDYVDSNGMILVQGNNCGLLLMRDVREGESTRPHFPLSNKHFCPECLIKALQDWLDKVR